MVILVIFSLLSGVVSGMGMGGGTLLIPVLTIFMGFSQHTAQGVNLLAFIPAALVSLFIHFKNKLVNIKIGVIIILVGCVVSFLAALLANSINANFLRTIFAVFLILIGIYQLITCIMQILKKKKLNKKNKPKFKIVFLNSKMFK